MLFKIGLRRWERYNKYFDRDSRKLVCDMNRALSCLFHSIKEGGIEEGVEFQISFSSPLRYQTRVLLVASIHTNSSSVRLSIKRTFLSHV